VGLTLGAGSSGSTVRGLVINRFGNGIVILSSANTVAGNYVGLDPTGAIGLGNATGVEVEGASNTIGGTTAADRNVISGNVFNGVRVFATPGTVAGNVIQGNYIGTSAAGTAAIPNKV